MSSRKLVAAALFFTLFGVLAFLPPFALLFRYDILVASVPLEAAYVFVTWILLIIGARWFSHALPDNTAPKDDAQQDRPK